MKSAQGEDAREDVGSMEPNRTRREMASVRGADVDGGAVRSARVMNFGNAACALPVS
jgi:hypothetical protein